MGLRILGRFLASLIRRFDNCWLSILQLVSMFEVEVALVMALVDLCVLDAAALLTFAVGDCEGASVLEATLKDSFDSTVATFISVSAVVAPFTMFPEPTKKRPAIEKADRTRKRFKATLLFATESSRDSAEEAAARPSILYSDMVELLCLSRSSMPQDATACSRMLYCVAFSTVGVLVMEKIASPCAHRMSHRDC